MSNVTALKSKSDPARAQLRSALALLVEATGKAAKHRTAILSTQQAARSAKKAAESFDEAISEATTWRANEIANAAAAGRPIPPGDKVRKARDAQQAALDES